MKRIIVAVIGICAALTILSACSNSNNINATPPSSSSASSSASSSSYDPKAHYKIRTSNAAIKAVENDSVFERHIASALKFKKNYSPNIGTTYAKEMDDTFMGKDYWKVTICGNMGGYTDDYLQKYDNKAFELTAYVASEDGEVLLWKDIIEV